MRRIIIVAAALCLPLVGCYDFDPVTQVKDFRVLGVSAEPPEIRPGDGVTLRVLWADPKGRGREVSFAWMGCSGVVHASEGLATCDMLVPPLVRSASEGGDALEISATPPDLLKGLPAGASLKATFIILMCAGGTLPAADRYESLRDTADINTLCKGGDGLSAFKTVTVSTSDNPQTNPVIDRLYFRGDILQPAADEEVGQVSCKGDSEDPCGETEAEMALFVTEESVQHFEAIEFREPVTKEDTVYLSWFVTGGDFDKSRSDDTCEKKHMAFDNPCLTDPDKDPSGPFEIKWIPEAPGTFTLYAVVHDIRGGVSWQTYTVEATR